jgi:hypothetical protein
MENKAAAKVETGVPLPAKRFWKQLASLEVGQSLVFKGTDIYKVCSAIQRYKVVTHGRKFTSAWTLRHVTGNAYSVRTFSDALRRLELIGHITREMTFGSHKHYPVVLHNYEARVPIIKDGHVVVHEKGEPAMKDNRVTYDWSRVGEDGSLYSLTVEEARVLGLSLDEQEAPSGAYKIEIIEGREQPGLERLQYHR